jgi:hypothetical protein
MSVLSEEKLHLRCEVLKVGGIEVLRDIAKCTSGGY